MKEQIFDAASAGNISMFRAALKTCSVDETNELGETPLMVACRHGHVELVKFILSRGADVSISATNGMTAYDFAEMSPRQEIAGLLGKPTIGVSAETGAVGRQLVALAINIQTIFTEFESTFDSLDDQARRMVMRDLSDITYLIRGQSEFSLIDCFGLALSLTYLSDKKQFMEIFHKILSDREEGVERLARTLFDSRTTPKQPITETNFRLNSMPYLNDDASLKVRKVLYEFSELIVKADGCVTKLETKVLKYLAGKLFESKTEEPNTSPSQTQASLDSILAELNSLVGLENVKNDIRTLINVIKVNQLRKLEGLPEQKLSMHSVFIGPPGTGKTTIARMLANIYFSLNVLEKNNFVEVDRSGLVAGYVGQTAIKTNEAIESALNGVLFIDEAYTLARKGADGDYGQEAIDILLKRMEDSRERLIVIVAGYKEEMATFINSNPGLASRFNRYFLFSDYTPAQLFEIFCKTSSAAGFVLTEEASRKVALLFDHLYAKRSTRFGNARLVRNIFEKTFEAHADRTATIAPISRADLTTIQVEDVPYDQFVNKLD